MQPLNNFLQTHIEQRKDNETAPKWLTFHDSDEYIYPVNEDLTLSEFLQQKDNTCCIQVSNIRDTGTCYREEKESGRDWGWGWGWRWRWEVH